MTPTAIVPAQSATSSIVPRPTKTNIIKAMALQLKKENEAFNKIAEEQQERLRCELSEEMRKETIKQIRKAKITPCFWSIERKKTIESNVVLEETPKIKALNIELDKWQTKEVYLDRLEKKIKSKIEDETIQTILEQQGMKNIISSTLVAIGLKS
jgi:hypothetical protein